MQEGHVRILEISVETGRVGAICGSMGTAIRTEFRFCMWKVLRRVVEQVEQWVSRIKIYSESLDVEVGRE